MNKPSLIFLCTFLVATSSLAVERKPVEAIDTDAYTADTQVTPKGAGDNHVALAWWISNEFWESVLSRDPTVTPANRKLLLDALAGISLLSVVQADISGLGGFSFYTKEEIEQTMRLTFTDSDGRKQRMVPMAEISTDLQIVLGVLKPVLGAAMGNLGNNMHFYVLDDRAGADGRLLDPYRDGSIGIQLARRDKALLDAEIELPINALFVPRKCPNGRDAHISWRYCPWSGQRLED